MWVAELTTVPAAEPLVVVNFAEREFLPLPPCLPDVVTLVADDEIRETFAVGGGFVGFLTGAAVGLAVGFDLVGVCFGVGLGFPNSLRPGELTLLVEAASVLYNGTIGTLVRHETSDFDPENLKKQETRLKSCMI